MNCRITLKSPRTITRPLLLSALVVTLAGGALLRAQTVEPPAAETPAKSADSTITLEQFVVTGSVAPRSLLETPRSITTVSTREIERMAPRSIDELLRAVPGLYVETGAGETHSNAFPRGVFSAGGFRYTAILEDGLPVITESETAFSSADNYTRVSNFISSVEGLRGGSSGIFTSNATLSTVNFINREGSSEVHGEAKLEAGDYGLIRNDLWLSGPLGKQATFAIGGFYRVSDGLRDSGFLADQGGSLSANIKYQLPDDRGYIKASAKLMDDRTAFYMPKPITGTGTNPQAITGGPDLLKGSMYSPDTRKFFFTGTPEGTIEHDLADGISVALNYIGTEIVYKLTDNLSIQNRNRMAESDKSWNALVMGATTSLQSIANSLAAGTPAAAGGAARWAAARNTTTGNYSFRLTYPGAANAVAAANASAAAGLNDNGLGNTTTQWWTSSQLTNFQDDLRLTFSANEGRTSLTAGGYYAWFKDHHRRQWNQELIEISPVPRRMDLTYLDATTGAVVGQYTYNGLTRVGTHFRNTEVESKEVSSYLFAEHKVGSLLLNGGLRHTEVDYSANGEDQRAFDLNSAVGGAAGLYPSLSNALFGSGILRNGKGSVSATALVVGANYELGRNFSVFGTWSDGPRTPTPSADNTVAGTQQTIRTEKIQQIEAGVKFGSPKLYVYATLYKMHQKDATVNLLVVQPDGTLVTTPTFLELDNYGLELEGIWTPVRGLSISTRANVQRPEVQNNVTIGITGGTVNIKGNSPTRVPKAFGDVTAEYAWNVGGVGRVSVHTTYRYTGKRYGDLANTQVLSAYGETSAGITLAMKNRFTLRLQASNLFDEVGLTESDPFVGGAAPGTTFFNARPIFGRSIVGSVSYSF